MSDSRIVDQDVHPAKFTSNRSEEIIHRVRVAHIARMGENSDFLTRQFPADPGQCLFIAAGQNEIAALSSQRACDGKTNPTTGPGDESRLAEESAHWGTFRHRSTGAHPTGRICGGRTQCVQSGSIFLHDFLHWRRGRFLALDIWRSFTRAISRPDLAISERSRSNSLAMVRNSLSMLIGIRNV